MPNPGGASGTISPIRCPLPLRREPLPEPGPKPSPIAKPLAQVTPTGLAPSTSPLPPPTDYHQRLRPSAYGWPILRQWCVWVEPPKEAKTPDRWEQRWIEAVDQALSQWAALLPLQRVERAEAAQIHLRRRRPALQAGADGRLRASHGRAVLSVGQVDRGLGLRLEPLVEIDLSPEQRAEALQATALHELGHAVGLWGHSDDPNDVMAVRPGAQPILVLTQRDRATLAWLYRQPTAFGQPLLAGTIGGGAQIGGGEAGGAGSGGWR